IDREQGISKAGNRRARHKAIELAWLWLRHQPNSALSHWFRTRTANAGRRAKRIAIVALARKLIMALWRYLTARLVPEGATMKSKTRARAGSPRRTLRRPVGWIMAVPPKGQPKPVRRWVSSSWLPRRKHAECGYGSKVRPDMRCCSELLQFSEANPRSGP